MRKDRNRWLGAMLGLMLVSCSHNAATKDETSATADSASVAVAEQKFEFLHDRIYLVKGEVGNSGHLEGTIQVNKDNAVLFCYTLNGFEDSEYGNYAGETLSFDSGMEAMLSDGKIVGIWKRNLTPHSDKPFTLRIIGNAMLGERDGLPPQPTAAPQISELLTIVDDAAEKELEEKESEKKETNAVEPPAVEIQYLPPTVEGKETVDDNRVYDAVEEMPAFPGGQAAFMKYLSSNMKYPKDCQEAGIQGRVVVKFIVDKDGRVTNARVAKQVHPSLDKEALRVINSMPRWTPGKQKGKPVRVTYTVPLMFRLN